MSSELKGKIPAIVRPKLEYCSRVIHLSGNDPAKNCTIYNKTFRHNSCVYLISDVSRWLGITSNPTNPWSPDNAVQNNERFDRSSCRIYMANKIWWWWYHSVTCQQCNARTHFIVHRFQPAVDAFKYYFIPRTILSWNAVYCLGLVGKSSKPAGSTEVFITRQHTDARYWYSKSVRLSVRP